ncbi:MAG: helix-turn-helix transcriptional regulator [Rhodospirillaceae bacterium]|nr:helix-turn-helix transcriptional regulator [Rhodospirillaceae bacterium]MBT3927027.1 helix-turn-helix transcriptional regulator [Rhodospirillaceae bacterium]MBT4427747.1 helix-turn-helix transcriptional regulator [Rhodospirillaceae bacterium]MBT5040502.1 helix-turn-helix transcriptional regulator [Rhodospirillaceae bacterium]MBT5675630.1 helix-turn-helix transcriptional regulator [Rhodospirillaceae bacterium]
MFEEQGNGKVAEFESAAERDKRANRLEMCIGREVRQLRRKHDMTVTELAELAGLSSGMLSKIENGHTSPSLTTLQSLASALNVSVTALMRKFEERRDATFVAAGGGLKIQRRGTRAGHEYRVLGHSLDEEITMEPFVITLTDKSEVFPAFEHEGTEFLYVLEGRMDYHHGGATYAMGPGDSLFFDAEAAHGPENLVETPIRFVCVIVHSSERP